MSSQNSEQARKEVHQWAVGHIESTVMKEARAVTKSRELQTMRKTVDKSMIDNFRFSALYERLSDMASTSLRIFQAFATSPRADKHTVRRQERTKLIVTSAALACLGEYSHANNLAKRVLGLYMYATGAQRQAIAVLSSLGLAESYSNIVSRNIARPRKPKAADTAQPGNELSQPTTADPTPPTQNQPTIITEAQTIPTATPPATAPIQRTGTLRQLSGSMRDMARAIASTGLYGVVYDNINIMFRNSEQVIGRHDSQENGTCATVFRLWKANIADLETTDFQKSFLDARPLRITDIIHTADESRQFKNNLVFTLLRLAVRFGGDGFKKFEGQLEKRQPVISKIDTHQTEIHPLPAWEIDESTIVGNAEVDNAIITELQLKNNMEEFWRRVRFLGGDQLSIAHLRALENIRAGHEAGYQGFFWGAWMPGLFHAKIADMHGFLVTHWGKPNAADRNPGCLAFHNTRLDRLPIVLSSLPPFRTSRDLVFVSLYARVLHCLLLVSKCKSLDEYICKTDSWEDFEAHGHAIYDQFMSASIVADLREHRAQCNPKVPPTEGDMVFENAVLFLRDAVISREFTDAIKAGDSGRVLLVLKIWALGFRGSGRTKYAYEMLHIIHNLTCVWPKPIRDIVMNNWLLNPTGKKNAFVEMDLVQEHLNFWIKNYYRAHGANASWEWLELVAPCVQALRDLANGMNDALGDDQGMRHAPADLTEDIKTLMVSLLEHGVYIIKKGRVLDDDDPLVKDIISVGLQQLMDSSKSPLIEYNENFKRLQRRRRKQAVVIPSFTSGLEPTMPAAPPAHGLETGAADVVSGQDLEEEPVESELALVLDEVTNGAAEPTLTREDAGDVALDMDIPQYVDYGDCDVSSGSEDGDDDDEP
ncbi:hypothetical protein DXG01_008587 [Tephrocybe rancida]|nr:hypothetical protein DXG01_008587 [Tephrocybe rancida]